jgi:protein-disulfide isomerase
MKTALCFSISYLLLCLAVSAGTQTPRRPAKRPSRQPPVAKPIPTPSATPFETPPVSRIPKSPIPLAVVNGQTITTADIDPQVRQEIESLDERVAEAGRQILERQINTLLLETAARKRKLTSQQLYDLEVSKRVTEPTKAEIDKFIEDNRDQIGANDEATIRSDVTALLRGQREAVLSEEFVRRLRITNAVVMGVDVNANNLSPSAVLATVAGRPITGAMVIERLKSTLYKLRLNAYEIEKQAVDETIKDLLLLAEASRRNVAPEEILRKEITESVHTPTEAEVAKFYDENKTKLNGDLDTLRNQIAEYLQDQDRLRLERLLAEKLRKGADVRLLLSEPQQPARVISADDDPSRGDATAPVTIVEFTDFQCPACAAMHPILEDVLKTYGNKVRFVVRDFPLTMHANARKAAEAANAANAQGKFFEYAALLFKRQSALDVPSLKKYASELGLDRTRFDAALDNGTYAAEVRHDIDDGEMYGVDSTPSIFINGVVLRTLSAEGLRAAIDSALRSTSSQPVSNSQ